jgi:hypothetical protein
VIEYLTPTGSAPETVDLTAIDVLESMGEIHDLVQRVQPVADGIRALALVLEPGFVRNVRSAHSEYRALLAKINHANEQLQAVTQQAAEAIAVEATRSQEAQEAYQREQRRLTDELGRATDAHHAALARLGDERSAAEREHREFLNRLAVDRTQAESAAAERMTALEAEIVTATGRRDAMLAEIEALLSKFAAA